MKKIIWMISAIVLWANAYSQQERQVSQYMYDQISVNPGSAGSSEMVSTHLIYRQQWVGIDGAPTDVILNLSAPFKLFKANHGVGLSIWSDQIGFNKDVDISLSYAYQFSVGNGKLGLGISGSYVNRKLDPEWITNNGNLFDDPNHDGGIPTGNQSEFTFDMGAGLFYRTEELYVGISSTHILQDGFVYQNESSSTTAETTEKMIRQFYLTAGYNITLSNPLLEILPSVFVQSDTKLTKIDLNTTFMYNKKFWAGVTYRVGSALVGMVGMDIMNGVKVGYSYDFETSALSNFSKGSHEIMVGYSFKVGIDKIPQKYKSIRFL
jgi:type IX secretion system PorP/SprF family membrane protein